MKNSYFVMKSIGKFFDEQDFKYALIKLIRKNETCKEILQIENDVEPGMPDLLLIDQDDKSIFIETKYSTYRKISFKRTQIPWYMQHRKLKILIFAYNSMTTNIHCFTSEFLMKNVKDKNFTLLSEEDFEIEETYEKETL